MCIQTDKEAIFTDKNRNILADMGHNIQSEMLFWQSVMPNKYCCVL